MNTDHGSGHLWGGGGGFLENPGRHPRATTPSPSIPHGYTTSPVYNLRIPFNLSVRASNSKSDEN